MLMGAATGWVWPRQVTIVRVGQYLGLTSPDRCRDRTPTNFVHPPPDRRRYRLIAGATAPNASVRSARPASITARGMP